MLAYIMRDYVYMCVRCALEENIYSCSSEQNDFQKKIRPKKSRQLDTYCQPQMKFDKKQTQASNSSSRQASGQEKQEKKNKQNWLFRRLSSNQKKIQNKTNEKNFK